MAPTFPVPREPRARALHASLPTSLGIAFEGVLKYGPGSSHWEHLGQNSTLQSRIHHPTSHQTTARKEHQRTPNQPLWLWQLRPILLDPVEHIAIHHIQDHAKKAPVAYLLRMGQ